MWYQLAMQLFHDTQISLKDLKTATIEAGADNMEVIIFNEKRYYIPVISNTLTN